MYSCCYLSGKESEPIEIFSGKLTETVGIAMTTLQAKLREGKCKELPGDTKSINFSEVFWSVWEYLGYQLPDNVELCYMFEMCTQRNRILVDYPNPRIIFHGARNLQTLKEVYPQDLARKYSWECVEYHDLKDLCDVQTKAEKYKVSENEGFIVIDAKFNRLKIKSSKYVACHHLASTQSHDDYAVLKVIQTNESEEYLAYFPQYKTNHDLLLQRFNDTVTRLENLYKSIDTKVMRDFAIAIEDEPLKSCLFKRKRKNTPIREGLSQLGVKLVYNHLN